MGEKDLLTAQATLDALARYDINDENLANWEKSLGLDIPSDANGHKLYSQHHINLFKNVKKHLALGRTLDQIRAIINLPPAEDAIIAPERPHREQAAMISDRAPSASAKSQRPEPANEIQKSTYATKPSAKSANKDIDAVFRETIEAERRAKQEREARAIANAELQKKAPAPKAIPSSSSASNIQVVKERPPKSHYPANTRSTSGASEVVDLVKRLTAEKDHLYQKLLETEKLNSHLYSANNLYHRRVKDLEQNLDTLRSQMPFDQNVKLMDDKAKLHKQVIDTDKKLNEREIELRNSQSAILELNMNIHRLTQRIEEVKKTFDASSFCGDWMENGKLLEIAYDNFGINVEPERVRLFRVSKPPERIFGNTAVITTNYQYETNPQWRRVETLIAAFVPDFGLEGEVTVEYVLDDVPVAKAIYRVHCKRNS